MNRAPLCSPDGSEALSASVIEDPYPFYARLRESSPLSRIGDSGVHIVANWALIEEALGREEDFSANLTGVLVRGPEGLPGRFELGDTGATNVIATADEPDHSVHRSLVQPGLTPAQIARLEPVMRKWTGETLAPFCERRGGDFAPLSERIPALALAHLLGLPLEDVERFRVWAMLGGDILAGDASAERLAFLGQETARMASYLSGHLERALDALRSAAGDSDSEIESGSRGDPDESLLSALGRGVLSGAIDARTAVGISTVLFGAAGESTAALIGSCVRKLAEEPELSDRLRREPALIPRFVEEIVRLEPPFKFHYRVVRRPCRLAGFDLEAGDRLMLSWAAANRDPSVFDEPDQLQLDRRFPKKHMGFGRGLHFCVGATLARLEARLMLETLLSGTTRIELDPSKPPVYANSIFVRRLEELPIAVDPA